jgi:benzoyl-CoA reductase/2-hydroxyglutaryl-CoA dehydratase subunit BcrC/BadD/HgdB
MHPTCHKLRLVYPCYINWSCETYELKREMRKEAWDKKGVVKVLKELDAKTITAAGPKIRITLAYLV